MNNINSLNASFYFAGKEQSVEKIEFSGKRFIKLAGKKQDQKVIFFLDSSMFPIAYFEYSFRKRENRIPLSFLRNQYKLAKRLGNFSEQFSEYENFSLVFSSKSASYAKRIDQERSLNTVISDTYEDSANSLKDAFNLLFNGKAHNAYHGGNIKEIVCVEKKINSLRILSDKIREYFDL